MISLIVRSKADLASRKRQRGGEVQTVDGVNDCLSEEKGTKLMAHTGAKVLGVGLSVGPLRHRELPDSCVQSLRGKRAG